MNQATDAINTQKGKISAAQTNLDPLNQAGGEPSSSSGDRNAETDFRGGTRINATHASTTDPESKRYRKGAGVEAKLAFLGHALMENRCGLVVDASSRRRTVTPSALPRWR